MTRRLRVTGPTILLSLYLGWNLLSVLWSQYPNASLSRVLGLVQVLLFYWMIVDAVRTESDAIKLIVAYVIGVGALATTAFANIALDKTYLGLHNRFSALGYDPNNFGVMVVSTIPLALAVRTRGAKLWSTLGIVYTVAAVLVVLSTASRTALIALLLGLVGYLTTRAKFTLASVKNALIITCVAVLTSMIAVYLVPEEATARLSAGFLADQAGGRIDAWQLALSLGASHPIGGLGAGTFLPISEGHLVTMMQAHNTFLAAFAELGLLGLIIWIGLWVWHYLLLFRTRNIPRELTSALANALLVVLIGTFALNWEIRKPVYLLWGLVAASSMLRSRTTD